MVLLVVMQNTIIIKCKTFTLLYILVVFLPLVSQLFVVDVITNIISLVVIINIITLIAYCINVAVAARWLVKLWFFMILLLMLLLIVALMVSSYIQDHWSWKYFVIFLIHIPVLAMVYRYSFQDPGLWLEPRNLAYKFRAAFFYFSILLLCIEFLYFSYLLITLFEGL